MNEQSVKYIYGKKFCLLTPDVTKDVSNFIIIHWCVLNLVTLDIKPVITD